MWLDRPARLRLEAPPPPIDTKPLPGDLYTLLLAEERNVLGSIGASQDLNNGKIIGKFVVMTAMNVSLVPHSAAN